ncbi:MAG: undecaprenyl/decaprenyl-phosphate alpha-N-acetylglucosaminyl 1-phosphate transferase [Chitinophagaceae bacterium]|jgi:UDP-N-acetylmuramyl pentapeptide phosphotransferase/UDP-N-acetylglucosamine-1-phosphate transferase|nr:undecaprenyl/decaprenyl-phosphate alpha-N-acetylglucosaminyl 1-phosphate transferase [Chitinophagaceae bacterium]
MDKILMGTSLAFFITFAAIPVIIQVADAKKLFDVPDARKVHLNPIPSLGGLGIFAGLILAFLVTFPLQLAPEFQYFLAAALVIFFLGLKDDILVISPIKKLIGQFIAAFLIIYKGGIQIKSMHGLLGVYELPEVTSLALTYLTVIVIINSFNLIDGVDGLAGSLGLMTALVFGSYFYYVGQTPYAMLAFILSGSLLGFLIFNHSPARIFMGDTGSLLLGLINAILVIRFIAVADAPGIALPLNDSPAIGFSILMVPLFDTIRVFSVRILNRRSPFSPDRNHIHHLLLDKGLSHSAVTYACVSMNLLFIAFAFYARSWGSTAVIAIMITTASLITAFLYFSKPRTRLVVDGQYPEGEAAITSQRVLSFRRKTQPNPEDN